jgi:hypothetical protein
MFQLGKAFIVCMSIATSVFPTLRASGDAMHVQTLARDLHEKSCLGKRGHRGYEGRPGVSGTSAVGAAGIAGVTGATGSTGPSGALPIPAYAAVHSYTPVIVSAATPFLFQVVTAAMNVDISNIAVNGQLGILESGDYDIAYFISTDLPGAPPSQEIVIRVNGVQAVGSHISREFPSSGTAGNFKGMLGEIILPLVVGDTVDLFNPGAAIQLANGLDPQTQTGYLIIRKLN